MNTGGPAFPVTRYVNVDGETHESKPQGMNLRDYFAAKAMQGMLATDLDCSPKYVQSIADSAYIMADAMLKAREQ